MNTLEIRDLTVHYRTDQGVVEALDKASLSIKQGEILGLVGESGCGKSTMGRAILRILPEPSGKVASGSISFQGTNLLELPNREMNSRIRGRAITIIPQDPFSSFNPTFTICTQFVDILKHKLANRSPEGASGSFLRRITSPPSGELKKRVIRMLKSVQIPSPEMQIYKYPHEFSGGQRQRIMIAMALATQPALIIADEPTTALDATIGAQVLELLRDLAKQVFRTSVLFITHDLGVAYDICDRVAVMYAGQIVESAPTDSFFKKPSHPYTRGLLGSLPNPEGKIKTIPGEIPILIDPPTGCRFHPRCTRAVQECSKERPDLVELFPDHWVRCIDPISH